MTVPNPKAPPKPEINQATGPTFINKQTVPVGVYTPNRIKIYVAPYEPNQHMRKSDLIYEVRGEHYKDFAGFGGPLTVLLPSPKAAPAPAVRSKAPARPVAAPPPAAPAAPADGGSDRGPIDAAYEEGDTSGADGAGDVSAEPASEPEPTPAPKAKKGSGLKSKI
jgi:hypothetical protein